MGNIFNFESKTMVNSFLIGYYSALEGKGYVSCMQGIVVVECEFHFYLIMCTLIFFYHGKDL